MGQSTNGILFYGINLGENGDEFTFDDEAEHYELDFETIYAAKHGLLEPEGDYDDLLTRPLFKAYWDKKSSLLKSCPCEIDTYGSSDYPLYFVAVKAGKYLVHRGYTTEIPDGLTAKPEWKEQIKAYCELMGLPYSDPKWLLVSYWG